MNKGKRAWYIGRLGENKTKELLKKEGYIVYSSDVDSAGIDIIAFKNNTIHLIEVKTTDMEKVRWQNVLSKKQFNKYKKLQKMLEKEGFNVKFILYVWKKENRKWVPTHFDFTEKDFI